MLYFEAINSQGYVHQIATKLECSHQKDDLPINENESNILDVSLLVGIDNSSSQYKDLTKIKQYEYYNCIVKIKSVKPPCTKNFTALDVI